MVELNAMVAEPVLNALENPQRLLDVGGGPGSFAIAACSRWSELRVTIADLPQAADLGRPRVAATGLSDRVRYVAGDARTSDLGSAHDVATLLQVLHNVDRAASVQLLRAAARGVHPGGLVVVLEIEAASTLMGALASLASTGWMGSRAWTVQQLTEMACDAGLRDVRAQRPARLPGSVLLLGNTSPATA